MNAFCQSVKYFARFVFQLCGVRISGLENLPQNSGFIMCANHKSNWDPAFLGALIPDFVRYLAKAEMFKIKLMSKVFWALGAIPIKRGKNDVGALKTAETILKNGGRLVIFPQGHRQKVFDISQGKKGAERLAATANVPVVPIGIFGRKIVVGKPLVAPNTETIMLAIKQICDEIGNKK